MKKKNNGGEPLFYSFETVQVVESAVLEILYPILFNLGLGLYFLSKNSFFEIRTFLNLVLFGASIYPFASILSSNLAALE